MSAKRDRAAIVGVGAAACAVCCAGPILGILAAIGLTTAVGVTVFGLAGLAIAALAIPVIIRRRRRSAAATCTPAATEPVSVTLDPPTLSPRSTTVEATSR